MFSWNNFDSEFIKEILKNTELDDFQKQVLQYAEADDDKDGLISVMLSVCVEPDADFIKKYRKIMECSLFRYHKEEVTKICNTLNISGRSFNDKLKSLMRKTTSSTLIMAYINVLHNIAGIETDFTKYSKFKTTVALRMSDTKAEEIGLHDFQEEAVERLRNHFITEDKNSGIMVMPTGSGKTRTSSYFLIKEMISQGYQVIWIAHRHMLIDQAADCFYDFAGLSKINNPGIKKYNICCISGEHLSIKQADKEEVIVATIQSICRSKEHLRRILKHGKVMVVIDECHHSVAKTYQETINFIRKCRKNVKLLGLTATPVRASDTLIDENGEIVRMLVFEDQIPGLKNMRADKESWINNPSFTGASAIQKYFNGFVYVPQEKELSLLMENYRTLEEPPTLHLLKEREYALPAYAIELSEKEERDIFTVGSELYDEHEVIRNAYSSKEDYLMELSRVKIYGKSSVVRTRVEELPYEKIPFDRTPVHDIEALYSQVVDEMFGGEYDGISDIAWTDKAYKTYYGVYYPDSHSIRINSVLNSPNVDAEVIKFVIYHEMLHRDFHKHDKVFREKEHEYPDYAEYEHFLDCNMNNFEIVEW